MSVSIQACGDQFKKPQRPPPALIPLNYLAAELPEASQVGTKKLNTDPAVGLTYSPPGGTGMAYCKGARRLAFVIRYLHRGVLQVP